MFHAGDGRTAATGRRKAEVQFGASSSSPAPAFASLLFFLRHAPTLATERCAAYPETLTIMHERRWRDAAPQMK